MFETPRMQQHAICPLRIRCTLQTSPCAPFQPSSSQVDMRVRCKWLIGRPNRAAHSRIHVACNQAFTNKSSLSSMGRAS
eukprot:5968763-Pleurochrysis_carterae.AAC.4